MLPSKHKPHYEAIFSAAPQVPIYVDLVNGFLDGSELRKYVPDFSDCTANTSVIFNSLNKAVEDFSKKNITFDDIADGIQMIGKTIQGIANVTTSCKKLPATFMMILNYTKKIAHNPAKWFALVSDNAKKNSMAIMWNLYNLDGLFKAKKYNEAGVNIGQVFKYIFEVKLSQFAFFSFPSSNNSTGPWDFAKCAKAYVVDGGKVVSLVIDLLRGGNGTQDVHKMYEALMDMYNTCKPFLPKQNLMVVPNIPRLKFPKPQDIFECLKAVQPVVSDLYNVYNAFKKGDKDAEMKALTLAGIDAIGAVKVCSKMFVESA
jgi:hypothetical protein